MIRRSERQQYYTKEYGRVGKVTNDLELTMILINDSRGLQEIELLAILENV